MPITNNVKDTILKGLVGKSGAFSNSVYVGLSSTDPAQVVTEPSMGGYARVLVGNSSQSATQLFRDPDNGSIKNGKFIYFPESTGSWGAELKYFVLYSAATGGTLLAYGLLESGGVATPIKVEAEKTVVMFRPEKLVISIPDEA